MCWHQTKHLYSWENANYTKGKTENAVEKLSSKHEQGTDKDEFQQARCLDRLAHLLHFLL